MNYKDRIAERDRAWQKQERLITWFIRFMVVITYTALITMIVRLFVFDDYTWIPGCLLLVFGIQLPIYFMSKLRDDIKNWVEEDKEWHAMRDKYDETQNLARRI